MLAKNIVSAAIRIFGICLVFFALKSVIRLPSAHTTDFMAFPEIALLISIGVAAILWATSYRIAALAVPTLLDEPEIVSATELEATGINLLGLYFSAQALNRLLSNLATYYMHMEQPRFLESDLSQTLHENFVHSTLQLIFGISLLIGVRPLVGLLHRLRTAGLR